MTGAIATSRYSADDFETASIRSAAPSYVSEAPSYHSINPFPEAVPPYSPPVRTTAAPRTTSLVPHSSGTSTPTNRQRTIGLPPVPAAPLRSVPNLNNFRIATWSSVASNPAARHYHNVAQRRMTAQTRDPVDSLRRAMTDLTEQDQQDRSTSRPLEDPYLVGEVAAARARQERIARESGDDILLREDRQWDWFLARMKDSDERERNWNRFRRDVDVGSRKKLLRRIGGRRLM
ncbi:hypothetical protein NCS57_00404100 [Fusarium keratoplasticum]|uniref:Uncharacterized protein n=1 Tax=Fusarium keratoplasticum TaxID=1328300 RepID=A0ACC0R7I8_9HYPO|nr:hypothetical protein NCS57_00404100 [Fusarium keratoplasticum]KAI8675045.1 hypothetical protein NCS57_00404100 [Fusarium keratoplasticum]KAI8681504.1 hypothetical protein NCS55_00401900 [Fusarium keratoplasticum]